MSAYSVALPEDSNHWQLPSRGRVGMWCLIAAESAIFTIFVVAYLFYIGKSTTGPQPGDVLHIPIFYTVCLLSSSVTIHLAARGIAGGGMGTFARGGSPPFCWAATFLYGTAREWIHLINDEGLTISTNLFGTTYYSLVGLHAFHVTMGLLALTIVAALYFSARLRREHAGRIEILSMYWHFVDAVWVVVCHGGLCDWSFRDENPREDRSARADGMAGRAGVRDDAGICRSGHRKPVTILGAILAARARLGWFRDVLPVEKHESLPVVQEDIVIKTSRESVERIALSCRKFLEPRCRSKFTRFPRE